MAADTCGNLLAELWEVVSSSWPPLLTSVVECRQYTWCHICTLICKPVDTIRTLWGMIELRVWQGMEYCEKWTCSSWRMWLLLKFMRKICWYFSTCRVHRAWYGWCHPRQFHFLVQGDSRSYNYVAALSSDDEPLWEEIMILAKLIPRVCHNINRWVTLAIHLFLVSPPQVCASQLRSVWNFFVSVFNTCSMVGNQ